jgi:hypothetical protein
MTRDGLDVPRVAVLLLAEVGDSSCLENVQTGYGAHHPYNNYIQGVLYQGVKWPWHDADPSDPSNLVVNNEWSYNSTASYAS